MMMKNKYEIGQNYILNLENEQLRERIKELVKIAKSEIENAKISIRNSRKDANNEIKKIEISTDQKAISEKEIQTLTDNYITRIDEIFSSKEKEILSI